MIKNFDELKQQLRELAEIVNSYKSEAVQLRVVDLVLGGREHASRADTKHAEEKTPEHAPRRGRRAAARSKAGNQDGSAETPSSSRTSRGSGRLGPRAALARLVDEGFFQSAKTIGDIVQHAETNLATKIKQSDISGPLARYVRDKKLTRNKNAQNQYEYRQT